jgi:DNA-binding NarL/FixJ family response regulator
MIDLLIADDHPIVREGLKRICQECPDMRVRCEAVDGDQALERALDPAVDVLLLDISMPGPGFLETMRRLRKERPSLRILVLSVHPEDHYAVRSLRAGAAGYLTKGHSADELAEAIRRVHTGGKYVTPTLAEKLAFELGPNGERPRHEVLSNREYEVLCKLGSGKRVKDIAHDLELSPKTVSTYRTRLLEKMKLSSSAELIRYAVENGLVA